MSEPKIYTKNYVNSNSSYTISHGSDTGYKLYDRDNDSAWISEGANSDLTTVTIEVEFYEGSVAYDRTIDTVMLLNHNCKAYRVYSWDGAAWNQEASESADDQENTVISFTAVETAKFKIEIDSTQSANAEKTIGELIVCALTLDIGKDLDEHSVKYRDVGKEIILGDGTIHKMIRRFSANRSQKYEASVKFSTLSDAIFESLKIIRDTGLPFLWVPESTERPGDVFYVYWVNPINRVYASKYKGSGHNITMQLKEV